MPLAPHIAQADQLQQLEWLGESTVRILLDAAASGGQLMVAETRLRRGDASPLHVHANEDEIFLVLDGTGIFWVGDQRHEVGAGGVAFLPRELPHAYRFTSETAHVLTICTPAGFEGFFRTAGHDRSRPRPDDWAITPATLASAMAQHGGEILGPPRSEED